MDSDFFAQCNQAVMNIERAATLKDSHYMDHQINQWEFYLLLFCAFQNLPYKPLAGL